ncbi:MAG: methyltransferase domain-containing protein [Planctomycetota bacterium]|jgi:SAM-dependent methyltransferase
MDIVCAMNLLEHLSDPHELLSGVSRILADDGRFLMALPNAADYGAAGPYWVGFRIDLEHLNYSTVESLGRLLARHDLYVENFWVSHQPGVERNDGESRDRGLFGRIKALLAWPYRRAQRDVLSACFRPCYLSGNYELKVLARKAVR